MTSIYALMCFQYFFTFKMNVLFVLVLKILLKTQLNIL